MIAPGLERLSDGELELVGRLPWASNYTLLARILLPEGGVGATVVYKPQRGEAPLWDFPSGTLCRREVAAYLVCRAAGWEFVPPTVLRDGPEGLGAVQAFIDHDPEVTAFELRDSNRGDLMAICVFDLAVNNADRKAGHVFRDAAGTVRAVDHGLCFNVDPKVRTVLWDFVGEDIPPEALEGLERLASAIDSGLSRELEPLLAADEIEMLRERGKRLLDEGVFPPPGPGRPYPWPPV